jgi:hypothetical protein
MMKIIIFVVLSKRIMLINSMLEMMMVFCKLEGNSTILQQNNSTHAGKFALIFHKKHLTFYNCSCAVDFSLLLLLMHSFIMAVGEYCPYCLCCNYSFPSISAFSLQSLTLNPYKAMAASAELNMESHHRRWLLAVGLICALVVFFVYSNKSISTK